MHDYPGEVNVKPAKTPEGYVFKFEPKGTPFDVDAVIRKIEKELAQRELEEYIRTHLVSGVWPSSGRASPRPGMWPTGVK